MGRVIVRRGPRGPYKKRRGFRTANPNITGNYLASTSERSARSALACLAEIAEQQQVDVPIWPGKGAISAMTRAIAGGRARFLDLVVQATLDGDETAKTWWNTYAALRSTEQIKVSFDDVCAACAIAPSDFVAMIVATGMKHAQAMTDLVASSFQPAVVRKMAKSAMRIGGSHAEIAAKDRHLFLQGRGFLPVPRNASMTVNVSNTVSANAKAAAAASSEPTMPDFLGDMSSLQRPKAAIQHALAGEVEGDESDT